MFSFSSLLVSLSAFLRALKVITQGSLNSRWQHAPALRRVSRAGTLVGLWCFEGYSTDIVAEFKDDPEEEGPLDTA